jgi:epimerase transport system membrane fusion protein
MNAPQPIKTIAISSDATPEVLFAKDDLITAPVVEKREPLTVLCMDDKPYRRLGMFVTVVMLGGFILWAAFAPLKSAIVSPGKVVVESRNKVVQHLDGGIVAKIYVKEGDLVKKGQLLLTLSDTQIQAQLDIVNSQLWESMASLERLTAERNGNETLTLSEHVLALQNEPKMAEYLSTQHQLFMVRRQAFHSEQSVLQKRIGQSKQQVQGLEQVTRSEQSRALSLANDVNDWQSLYDQQFADKVRLRDMQRQLTELEGNIASKRSDVLRFKQVTAETEHQILLRQQEYLKEVADQTRDAQTKRSEAEARRAGLIDQLRRIDILAPDDGRVVGFDVVTVGAVIEARRAMMQIVPDARAFLVVGRVQTTDIDMIAINQKAEIKFTAYNTSYLPVLYGHVINIGADALMDEATKQPYYEVKVLPDSEAVSLLEKQGWLLVSGMPADTYIMTHERTLFSYIIKPLSVMFSRAFNEDDGLSS